MEKIQTLFKRSADRQSITGEVTPGCEWVLAGEGVARRKVDGTCVLIRRDGIAVHGFARRIVKSGKATPPAFVPITTDPNTGNVVGWEPIGQSGFAKFFDEAVTNHDGDRLGSLLPGTYELVGPKINGNPEGYDEHTLLRHDTLPEIANPEPCDFDTLRMLFTDPEAGLAGAGWEGLVWTHPDGRRAKLKVRDFRQTRSA